MTNFNTATKSFTLHAEGTQSYAWAWEGINRTETLAEIEATNNDIIAYAHGWAEELCSHSIDQIKEDGEMGFTVEEITNDLIDDRHALANALQAWLEEDEDPEDDQDQDDEEPTPFSAEVAVRLLEEGFITETDGIYIARPQGYAGDYDISTDSDDYDLYEVVWVQGINASHEAMTKTEVIALIREEAELGATFYWQTLPNNEWELTNAPTLPEPQPDQDEDLSRYDSFIEEDEYASDEAYLGESTLAKVRRQKVLLLEDRTETPTHPEGFEVVYGGWANGAGGLDNPRVVVFADRASFEAQNPNWAEMIEDAKHRQASPFTNLGNIYLFDRPEGGYEIYPRDGRTRADGSVAEIW